MCGRYKITSTIEAIRQFTNSMGSPNFPPRYNMAPTQQAPVVHRSDSGEREVSMMRWGLVPSWSKELPKKPLINARSETAASKPSFRSAYKHRRCLVPADGYYEWTTVDGARQPNLFRRADDGVFAFAGLWEEWKNRDDNQQVLSFTIMTTEPSELVRPYHDRMPVILAEEQFAGWLGEAEVDDDALAAITASGGDEDFVVYQVSKRVNSPRNDDEGCIEPVADDAPRSG